MWGRLLCACSAQPPRRLRGRSVANPYVRVREQPTALSAICPQMALARGVAPGVPAAVVEPLVRVFQSLRDAVDEGVLSYPVPHS